mgnify:CR=1 FL=1
MRAALLLAGGLSRRMGKPKQFLDFHGTPLIARVAFRLATVVNEMVVAINRGDNETIYKQYLPESTLIVKDEVDIQAPLVGFCSGLKPVKSPYTFVTSCDAPFVNPKVVDELFKRVEGADAALPLWPNGMLEPLHAVYRTTRTLEAACKCVKARRFKNLSVLDYLSDVRYVSVEELRSLDPELLTFLNINTLEDYEAALKLAYTINGG